MFMESPVSNLLPCDTSDTHDRFRVCIAKSISIRVTSMKHSDNEESQVNIKRDAKFEHALAR